MEDSNSHLQTLNEIKNLMEKSSRFISLSGLSGISAGIVALIGATAAYFKFNSEFDNQNVTFYKVLLSSEFRWFIMTDAILMIITAFSLAIFFTIRKSKKTGQSVWDHSAKNLAISLLLPLSVGGIFCLALFYHNVHNYIFMAPAMLVFYGLALLNASKYTIHSIYLLAYAELGLGIISSVNTSLGYLFWAIGFGVCHIIYGIFMYYKYER